MGDTHSTRSSAYLEDRDRRKEAQSRRGRVSRIAHAAIGRRAAVRKEVFGFVIFLFIGGLDTVFATLNNIWFWLAENPDRRKEIIARPDDINAIVEELLRVYSVTFSGRTVDSRYRIRGVQMKKGDKVTASCLPAISIPMSSPTRRKWISTARARPSSPSPSASTAAWARISPAWKSRSRCRNGCGGFRNSRSSRATGQNTVPAA